ncbi:AEC family transporter [Aquisalimonas sp.]|uniref:AEC family transporter n=1 Tax=Aquisalimonas sp. TaxID=1872621 RepID=UPI0025C150FC|nr:AEC family transporter [Aquisalimonas sp.]
MEVILTIALPFFALIFTGMIAGRTRLMPGETIVGLNKFVFFFALPALLVSSIAQAPVEDLGDPRLFLAWLIPGAVLFAATYWLAGVVFGGGAGTRAVQALAATFANVGFVGLPLVIAALGPQATPAAAVVIVVDTAIMIGIATAIIEVDQGGSGSLLRAVRTAAQGVVRNPLIVASVVGTLMSAFALSLPEPVFAYLELLGAAAGPAALFALGATLARQPLGEQVGETGLIVVVKLIVHPALVWGTTTLLGLPPIWQAALVIMASLPVAANVYVLAQRYHVNVAGASTAILATTVIAVATVSAVLHLILE